MSSSRRAPNVPPNRPLYAIDFTAVACGKRIANTKRRVRWRFGFANTDALAAGETGTACRGEEHDITLVWSITSGKRLILADGQEVHFSNSRSSILDFSWTMRGNHVLKVVAHATAPMSADPGFRQYDFYVDGRTFFSFPKVYRLGLTGTRTMSPDNGRVARPGYPAIENSVNSSRRKGENGAGAAAATDIQDLEQPHNQSEEEAYLREAIKASIESEQARQEGEEKEKGPAKPNISAEAQDLLLDFMDDSFAAAPAIGVAPPVAAAPADSWALTAPTQSANQWAVPATTAVVAPQPSYDQFAAPTTSNDWATPAPATNDWATVAVAPQPSYDQFGGASNSFAAPPPVQQPALGGAPPNPSYDNSFAAPPSVQQPAPMPPTQQQPQFSMSAPVAQPNQQDPFAAGAPPPAAPIAQTLSVEAPESVQAPAAPATPKLTMNSLNGTDSLLGSGGGGSMVDQAVQNLMGNIDSFGITGAAAKPPERSRNNPFANSNNILSNTTLGELKAKTTTGSEKKSVMNAPPGALVVAGNQSGNWGGYAGQPMQHQQQPPMAYGGQMGAGAPPMQQQAPQYGMAGGYQQQQQPPMAYGGQMGGGQMGGGAPPMQQQAYGAYGAPPQQPQGMYQQPPQQPPQQQYQQPQQPQWGGAPTY